jgi:hypothetical protein
MIITEMYKGQGLGNQLACYITIRTIALDNGFEFGVMRPDRFKGKDFFENIDYGNVVEGGDGPEGGPPTTLPDGIKHYYREAALKHQPSNSDIRGYDQGLMNVIDNTKVDGLMQGEQYFLHRRNEIKDWLKVKAEYDCSDYADDNTCIINFRGGEYSRVPEFFLDKNYWADAIRKMLDINNFLRFIVITDDVLTAKKMFPNYAVFHFSIGKDFSIIKNAHYLILSNSSFGWFPAWINKNLKFCIAPKYWARHNFSDGYWSLGYNLTSGWKYLDRSGMLFSYEECLAELKIYNKNNMTLYKNDKSSSDITQNKNTYALLRNATPVWLKKLVRESRGLIQHSFNLLLHPFNLYRERKTRKQWISNVEILDYKKTIKVYDVFYFFNELDLLEIRLNILDAFVDYFVLIEFSTTFGGVSKESHYKKNFERFSKWNSKIIYYLVEDYSTDKDLMNLAVTNSNVGDGGEHWVREFCLKESAKNALINLRDDDVVFLSDLDEIWNPARLKDLTSFEENFIVRPIQLSYYYYLNNRSNEGIDGWTGTIVCTYGSIKNRCLNDLRNKKKTPAKKIKQGGWHFTYMGGVEGAQKKLSEENHPEYKKFVANLMTTVGKNKHYAGKRLIFWQDEGDLPEYLVANKEKWGHLFR